MICFEKTLVKNMKTSSELDKLLAAADRELADLDARRNDILRHIQLLKAERELAGQSADQETGENGGGANSKESAVEAKIALFRSLFRGREDVYPRRFESAKTGKAGYQPVCQNEWKKPFCKKPKVRCGDCKNRQFLPVTDEVIKNHLRGVDLQTRSKRDFTIGVYPLLSDESCWFIVADFDKSTWIEDTGLALAGC